MNIVKKNYSPIKSKEEKQLLCEEWKKSGKTKTEFCRELGIPLATFACWCARLWPNDKKNVAIAPVQIINHKRNDAKKEMELTEIELTLGSGAHLRFKLASKNIVSLIQELSHAITTVR